MSCSSFFLLFFFFFFFFFFQAEDGIRDLTVTGVQTCALPIFGDRAVDLPDPAGGFAELLEGQPGQRAEFVRHAPSRSEERRVGKSVDLGGRRIIKKKKKKKKR